jgi:hypothetical protein
MSFQQFKTQYDLKASSAYNEFTHICENMLGLDMSAWSIEPSKTMAELSQENISKTLDYITQMVSVLDMSRTQLREMRMEMIEAQINQISGILPRMDYSGHSPKESRWVTELIKAVHKNEPICTSPIWRESQMVLELLRKQLTNIAKPTVKTGLVF